MTYDEIHPTLRNYLGGHEGLRKLGFKSEDIYFCVQTHPTRHRSNLFLLLKTQGKEFSMDCGPVEGDPVLFTALGITTMESVSSAIILIDLCYCSCACLWAHLRPGTPSLHA